jgi:hypothetical protein
MASLNRAMSSLDGKRARWTKNTLARDGILSLDRKHARSPENPRAG